MTRRVSVAQAARRPTNIGERDPVVQSSPTVNNRLKRQSGSTGWSKTSPHILVQVNELPVDLLEADFQRIIVSVAQYFGWMVTHFRAAMNQSGRWSTPMQGDKGFPDTVLARDGVVIFAELKTNKGRVSAEQRSWLNHLGEQGRLWRPRDWSLILEELQS